MWSLWASPKAMLWSQQHNIYTFTSSRTKLTDRSVGVEVTTSHWGSLAFRQQHTLKFKLRLSSSFCRDFHPYQMNYRPLWKRSSFLKICSCDSTFSLDYSKTARGWGKWEKVRERSESYNWPWISIFMPRSTKITLTASSPSRVPVSMEGGIRRGGG